MHNPTIAVFISSPLVKFYHREHREYYFLRVLKNIKYKDFILFQSTQSLALLTIKYLCVLCGCISSFFYRDRSPFNYEFHPLLHFLILRKTVAVMRLFLPDPCALCLSHRVIGHDVDLDYVL